MHPLQAGVFERAASAFQPYDAYAIVALGRHAQRPMPPPPPVPVDTTPMGSPPWAWHWTGSVPPPGPTAPQPLGGDAGGFGGQQRASVFGGGGVRPSQRGGSRARQRPSARSPFAARQRPLTRARQGGPPQYGHGQRGEARPSRAQNEYRFHRTGPHTGHTDQYKTRTADRYAGSGTAGTTIATGIDFALLRQHPGARAYHMQTRCARVLEWPSARVRGL